MHSPLNVKFNMEALGYIGQIRNIYFYIRNTIYAIDMHTGS